MMTSDLERTEGLTSTEKRRLLARLLRREALQTRVVTEEKDTNKLPFGKLTGEEEMSGLGPHRQLFPALANKVYFNYGAQGPMPLRAIAAVKRSYELMQACGPFSIEANARVKYELDQTRNAFAEELSVRAEDIALTENVSMGCNIVLWGTDWKAGDHLLLSDCENPGIVAAAQNIGRRFNVEVSTCPLGATLDRSETVAVTARHLRPNTRLVVLSHVLWNTGRVLPLAEIVELCRKHSTWKHAVKILADGAQSVGVLPLNLIETGVDFYAFSAHKWWCGPEGVGGLYIKPEALKSLLPTFIGWRSLDTHDADEGAGLHAQGQRFEVATSAYPLCAGFRAALITHRRWGSSDDRYRRVRSLCKYLWRQLVEMQNHTSPPMVKCLQNSPPEAGIVSFQVAGKSSQKLVEYLETRGLMVRTMHAPDCVRVCVHYLTLRSELDRLCEEIRSYCRARQ